MIGFIILFLLLSNFMLLAWAMIIRTDLAASDAENTQLFKNITVMEKELSTASGELFKCQNDINKYRELYELCMKEMPSVPVIKNTSPCVPCMKGIVLKCGYNECLVRWEDGRKEKLPKLKVHELILSGTLLIGTNKNVNLHGPRA